MRSSPRHHGPRAYVPLDRERFGNTCADHYYNSLDLICFEEVVAPVDLDSRTVHVEDTLVQSRLKTIMGLIKSNTIEEEDDEEGKEKDGESDSGGEADGPDLTITMHDEYVCLSRCCALSRFVGFRPIESDFSAPYTTESTATACAVRHDSHHLLSSPRDSASQILQARVVYAFEAEAPNELSVEVRFLSNLCELS